MLQIESYGADIKIYTDGSAAAGLADGGAAAVVTTGPPTQPNVVETIKHTGRKFTSSYEEELAALESAISWIAANENFHHRRILLCTDSQSLCKALRSTNPELASVSKRLDSLRAELSIQWIPGHCDIPGNELADAAAKSASELDEERPPISVNAAWTTIKKNIRDPPPTHARIVATYTGHSSSRDASEIDNRSDQVLLARLRSGHHPAFRAYLHRMDPDVDPTCPICQNADHTLEHWLLDCPGTSAVKREMFGTHEGSLTWLSSHPSKSVALAKSTLLGSS